MQIYLLEPTRITKKDKRNRYSDTLEKVHIQQTVRVQESLTELT